MHGRVGVFYVVGVVVIVVVIVVVVIVVVVVVGVGVERGVNLCCALGRK